MSAPDTLFRRRGFFSTMSDLIRTLEADLFGAYEWAAEFYEDLREVPEAPDRLAVYRGLLRAYEALEDKADEAMRAAEGLVEAEETLDEKERAAVDRLDATREALLADPDAQKARAFVAAFDEAWHEGPKQALLPDLALAALAHSNVIASRERGKAPEAELKAHHAKAAHMYEELGALLNFRVATGSALWRETAQSAMFRASVAWRLAGEEDAAKRAAERAGPPPEAEKLEGRGLRRT